MAKLYFRDRQEAGLALAQKLMAYKNDRPIVIALPRGGIPVAAEIARKLQTAMDILFVKKLGAPKNPELGVGAVTEDRTIWLNDSLMRHLDIAETEISSQVSQKLQEMGEQIKLYRGDHRLPDTKDKTVILVDDGLATGATMMAAVLMLKKTSPKSIIVAIPTAATGSAEELREQVEDVVSLVETRNFISVSSWYEDFPQVSDREVITTLKSLAAKFTSPEAGVSTNEISIPVNSRALPGVLQIPADMKAMILFAHGSGSSHTSPRNKQVAHILNKSGFGTLLFDLLTDAEGQDRELVFNIEFLKDRLLLVTRWIRDNLKNQNLFIGYFGASTGAAAALRAAAHLGEEIYAVVSRGGRPDLAQDQLKNVRAPTLLIVGSLDHEVIGLNEQCLGNLAHGELVIIPGATHVFPEPGALEAVAEHAKSWFDKNLPKSITRKTSPENEIISTTLNKAISITDSSDLSPLLHRVRDRRVVMLGESTHGTEEFYSLRREISQRLLADHGFRFIAVEGDWTDAERLNAYIRTGEGGSAREVLAQFRRWPTWMWANEEVNSLIEWMRQQNGRYAFYGLDVYSLFESMESVLSYTRQNLPDLNPQIEAGYACFDPYDYDEIAYAKSLMRFPSGCKDEVVANLRELLRVRLERIQEDHNELFSAQQNARVVVNAERYYRAMLEGDARSWNIRDHHMMDTLDALLRKTGETARGIVWAHNTHVGDYHATDMAKGGYVNLGGLARERYGINEVALIGFGTNEGEVMASHAWGGPQQVMHLPQARGNAVENAFHKVANLKSINQFYLLFDHTPEESSLALPRGHRAVGVVYDPEHEQRRNYVPTLLNRRYDAFIFVDKTQAIRPIPTQQVPGELPETWPSGE